MVPSGSARVELVQRATTFALLAALKAQDNPTKLNLAGMRWPNPTPKRDINTTQLSYFFLLGRRRSFLTRKCTSHRVVSRASARDVGMVNMRYYLSTKDACYAPNAKNADPISLRWPHNVVREG